MSKKKKVLSRKPSRRCTRCGRITRDWYARTGGAGLAHTRCNTCYEDELRKAMREDIGHHRLQEVERKATKYRELE